MPGDLKGPKGFPSSFSSSSAFSPTDWQSKRKPSRSSVYGLRFYSDDDDDASLPFTLQSTSRCVVRWWHHLKSFFKVTLRIHATTRKGLVGSTWFMVFSKKRLGSLVFVCPIAVIEWKLEQILGALKFNSHSRSAWKRGWAGTFSPSETRISNYGNFSTEILECSRDEDDDNGMRLLKSNSKKENMNIKKSGIGFRSRYFFLFVGSVMKASVESGAKLNSKTLSLIEERKRNVTVLQFDVFTYNMIFIYVTHL